jgi:hypothetical protein
MNCLSVTDILPVLGSLNQGELPGILGRFGDRASAEEIPAAALVEPSARTLLAPPVAELVARWLLEDPSVRTSEFYRLVPDLARVSTRITAHGGAPGPGEGLLAQTGVHRWSHLAALSPAKVARCLGDLPAIYVITDAITVAAAEARKLASGSTSSEQALRKALVEITSWARQECGARTLADAWSAANGNGVPEEVLRAVASAKSLAVIEFAPCNDPRYDLLRAIRRLLSFDTRFRTILELAEPAAIAT